MINFSELPSDGIAFEQLCRELLIRQNFQVHWTGVGQDSGRDLIIIETAEGVLAPFQRKWLVSCKHNANSGKSIGISDVINLVDDCKAVDAKGFLLICSTHPSAQLVRRLEDISKSNDILTCCWDSVELFKRLNTPQTFSLVHIFFPKNKLNDEWQIYNALKPSFWCANYKGFFFYMESRTEGLYPSLNDLELIINKIIKVRLPVSKVDDEFGTPEKHYLRPRLISYDNKACVYSVRVDYLYPNWEEEANILSVSDLENQLESGRGLHRYGGESMITIYHINSIGVNQVSDHFHEDHKEFYSAYITQG